MSDAGGAEAGVAETPAAKPPAEAVPEVAASATEPVPEIEIEAAPHEKVVETTSHGAQPALAPVAPASSPSPALETPAPAPQTVPPPPPQPVDTSIKSRLNQALEAIRFRKRAKLDKILVLAVKKKSIKNDDVEKLLRVSDTTATNYLNQLVRSGRLKRVGNSHQPSYEPV